MPNSKKFVVKNGLQSQNIDFVSPNESNTITISMLDSDTLSISGNSGQLFSITDSQTGTIFAVNDISGVPSIEVFDTGKIQLAETFGNVLIGTATDSGLAKLQINGNAQINGGLYDSSASIGTSGYVLSSTGTGISWKAASALQGTSGYSGYSGISGWSGISGYSGISGWSGISGYSGW